MIRVPPETVDPHQAYVKSLNPEEEQLIIIRDFLYEGDWEEILQDLRGRQLGKPFIFKLNTRIEEDIQRIKQLREYERRNSVNLGCYIRPEELKSDPGKVCASAKEPASKPCWPALFRLLRCPEYGA